MFIKQINVLISAMLLSLLFTNCIEACDDDDDYVSHRYYCRLISCSNPSRHILCLHPRMIMGKRCGDYFLRSALLQEEKDALLELHVNVRKWYVTHKNKNITFPEMHWDNDLQEMAQRWAEQCPLENDECRSLQDYGYVVKQNVGHYSVVDYLPHLKRSINFDLKEIVKYWAQMPLNPANPRSETYKPVDRIGCGLTIARECDWYAKITQRAAICRNYYHLYIVCNYAISTMHFRTIQGPAEED